MNDTKPGQQDDVAGNISDMASAFEGDDLFVSLDNMAERAAIDLEVDRVMISISQGDLLQTLGSFPAIGENHAARAHTPSDTVCAQAIKLEAPLSVEDASLNVALRDLPYVKNGLIVGYLGVPIDVAGFGVVGSLCAISGTPRAWSPLELKYLEQFARTISMCLLAGINKVEHGHLSDDLSALDQIVATLAAELSVPTSIYTESGELAFANAALTAITPMEIITAYRKNSMARASETIETNDEGQPSSEWIKFDSSTGVSSKCRVVCSKSGSGLTVCNWFPNLSEVG